MKDSEQWAKNDIKRVVISGLIIMVSGAYCVWQGLSYFVSQ